jgi:hypothetical protein
MTYDDIFNMLNVRIHQGKLEKVINPTPSKQMPTKQMPTKQMPTKQMPSKQTIPATARHPRGIVPMQKRVFSKIPQQQQMKPQQQQMKPQQQPMKPQQQQMKPQQQQIKPQQQQMKPQQQQMKPQQQQMQQPPIKSRKLQFSNGNQSNIVISGSPMHHLFFR